jgi:hypothetical protein
MRSYAAVAHFTASTVRFSLSHPARFVAKKFS